MQTIDIFLERMAVLVYVEKRPFCYKDFLFFEREGREYRYEHGTIRNIFAKLRKEGKIEFVYQSIQAYHTLTGANVGKSITLNHGVDYLTHKQNRFLKFLIDLPMDKDSIHNIRLRFLTKGLWSMLSTASVTASTVPAASRLVKSIDLENNKDITLHDMDLKDHTIKTTVHRTDTVSVMVACSDNPMPMDILGLSKLTSGLTRVEERLRMLQGFSDVDGSRGSNEPDRRGKSPSPFSKHRIPDHMSWVVTMWHFGQDSLTGYNGEKFEVPWKEGLELFRIYSKKSKNNKTMRIRKERQEYPNKPLGEALMDKMEAVNDSGELLS
jgi:hypothetical protein